MSVISKPLKSGKNLYTIHAYTTPTVPISLAGKTRIRICSIDMGREHFGIEIETRLIINCQLLLHRDAMLKHQFEPAKTNGISYFYKQFNDLMRSYEAALKDCDFILIEKQLPVNTDAYRDQQHLISFFMTAPFNPNTYVIEISSKAKTKYLGCPANVKDIKKWCADMSLHLMAMVNDQPGLQYVAYLRSRNQKIHEIGDTVCQAEAFMKMLSIDLKDNRFCILK